MNGLIVSLISYEALNIPLLHIRDYNGGIFLLSLSKPVDFIQKNFVHFLL